MLITDLHMPEMDGYGLTKKIREEEPSNERMPIILLTANALKGEEAQAKLIGVDTYVTKPIELDVLRKTLESCFCQLPSPIKEAAPVNSEKTSDMVLFDSTVLIKLLGCEESAAKEFLLDYLETVNPSYEELKTSVMENDLVSVASLAHRLKSSSRSIGALRLGDACESLEKCSRADGLDAKVFDFDQFKNIYERTIEAVSLYAKGDEGLQLCANES